MRLAVIRQLCTVVVLTITVFVSCKNKPILTSRVINIGELQKPSFDTTRQYTRVQILKTYEAQADCNADKHYVNLYVCKQRSTLDTIYVFDECGQAPDFARDTTINIEVVLYRNDTLKNHPSQVTVFVPKEFKVSKNARYTFTKLKGIVL